VAFSDAEMQTNILGRLNANPLPVAYTGYGSTNVWANSSVSRADDAAGFISAFAPIADEPPAPPVKHLRSRR